jgi:hypothetical protein
MAEQELDRLIRKLTTALTGLSEAKTRSIGDTASASHGDAVDAAYRSYEAADDAIRDYVFRIVGHRH